MEKREIRTSLNESMFTNICSMANVDDDYDGDDNDDDVVFKCNDD